MRRILALAILVMALAACGGSSGSGGGGNVAAGPAGDPVGAVNNFINAIKAKAFDKLGPWCVPPSATRSTGTTAQAPRPDCWTR